MLDFSVTRQFFDKAAVTKAVDENEAKRMSKFGAFARTDMQRSIRPANKAGDSAEPGSPPRSHTKLLKHTIFYSYVPDDYTVYIGPVGQKKNNGTPVPQLL